MIHLKSTKNWAIQWWSGIILILAASATILIVLVPWAKKKTAQGSGQNYEEADSWLRKMVNQGVSQAQYDRAPISIQPGKAAQEAASFRESANLRDVSYSSFYLGYEYGSGEGTARELEEPGIDRRKVTEPDKDTVAALQVSLRETFHREAMALCNSAWHYATGNSVPRDPKKAFALYLQAAEKYDIEAQTVVAADYYLGDGVQKDPAKAFYWFMKAAEQGDANSQYNVGACYEEGEGALRDTNRALLWFRKAAEQGYGPAKEKVRNYEESGAAGQSS